ncbi:hypothetical protein B9Z55_018823 [Caenorhabditis nigoni]|uniref:Phosphate carrier protein, mitochondrial n=1 Tax=Caenorhabditis nigoni TaxID=1611254 RepID=A0A2G5TFW9_9PELO|nr:hypothetical protein B9Z55_018823 [Caenorhabditis nigoni]
MGPFLDLMKNALCSPLSPSSSPSSPSSSPLVPFGSPKFYVLCGMGGSICCGFTHLVITPLDIVKCRMQVDPVKYSGVLQGFRVAVADDGVRGLARAWAPTTIGYSAQGFGKFGYYEIFKNVYGSMLSEENAYTYRSWVYLAAASSAEFFADFFLAPFEAVKVRMQTSSTAPKTMRECMPMIYKKEGMYGFFKGLPPLWTRQIPYTTVKFVCFERIMELMYTHVVPKPRSECTKAEQLMVTFSAGYLAGILCAVASHPPDVLVSQLNQDPNATLSSAAKKLGSKGMWAGLGARIIMIGTITAMQWFIYDGWKVLMGIPRPPPAQMPESIRRKLEAENRTDFSE